MTLSLPLSKAMMMQNMNRFWRKTKQKKNVNIKIFWWRCYGLINIVLCFCFRWNKKSFNHRKTRKEYMAKRMDVVFRGMMEDGWINFPMDRIERRFVQVSPMFGTQKPTKKTIRVYRVGRANTNDLLICSRSSLCNWKLPGYSIIISRAFEAMKRKTPAFHFLCLHIWIEKKKKSLCASQIVIYPRKRAPRHDVDVFFSL